MITCKAFKVGFLTDSAVSVMIGDDTLTVQSVIMFLKNLEKEIESLLA